MKSKISRIVDIRYGVKIKCEKGNEETEIYDALDIFVIDTLSRLCVCVCVCMRVFGGGFTKKEKVMRNNLSTHNF